MLDSSMLHAAFLAGLAALPPGGPSSVTATLHTEHAAARPGRPLLAGVRLVMQPGWHTYWSNPGDSGLPTKIAWTLPPGWSAGPILWPPPSLFADGPIGSYGYTGEVLLAATLQPPSNARGPADIEAKVAWLECEEICRPGKAALRVSVPVDPAPAQPSKDAALFAAVRKSWPLPAPAAAVSFEAQANAVVVSWPASWAADTAQFFPEAAGITEPTAEQVRSTEGKRSRLRIARPAGAGPLAPGSTGVLVLGARGSKKAYRVTWRSPR
jgi:thiol:disulfide interchange protein DsbD